VMVRVSRDEETESVFLLLAVEVSESIVRTSQQSTVHQRREARNRTEAEERGLAIEETKGLTGAI